jgi:hypothetical protein
MGGGMILGVSLLYLTSMPQKASFSFVLARQGLFTGGHIKRTFVHCLKKTSFIIHISSPKYAL